MSGRVVRQRRDVDELETGLPHSPRLSGPLAGSGGGANSEGDAGRELLEVERSSWAAIEEVIRVHNERLSNAGDAMSASLRRVHRTYFKTLDSILARGGDGTASRGETMELQATVEELQRHNVELLKAAHKASAKEALALVSEDPDEAMRRLDEVAGIHEDLTTGKVTGSTRLVREGLEIMPLWMVRGLEYEASGRKLGLEASELRQMDPLFKNESLTSHTLDGKKIVRHLSKQEYHAVGFAKWVMGTLHTFGASGVEKNSNEAMRYMEKAVLLGNADAAYSMGCVAERLNKDPASARKFYELAILWGHSLAANNLGSLLLQGASDVPMNAAEARDNFVIAIERGERLYAPMNLGELYLAGAPGVDPNPTKAAEYLLLALSEGDSVAKVGARKSMHELIAMQEKKHPGIPTERRGNGRLAKPGSAK